MTSITMYIIWSCNVATPLTTPILIDYKEVTLTIEMRETNKVGHVKLFTNEIEALTHEMNKFGFVTPTFVVKSELTQLVPLKASISGNLWFVCMIHLHRCIETYSRFRAHISKQTLKIWFTDSFKQAYGGTNKTLLSKPVPLYMY